MENQIINDDNDGFESVNDNICTVSFDDIFVGDKRIGKVKTTIERRYSLEEKKYEVAISAELVNDEEGLFLTHDAKIETKFTEHALTTDEQCTRNIGWSNIKLALIRGLCEYATTRFVYNKGKRIEALSVICDNGKIPKEFYSDIVDRQALDDIG